MKDRSKNPLDDDIQLDRLVDGELTAEEYDRLIASLDEEPNGWRRCATAFLEAQAWGQEFSAVRRHAEQPYVGLEVHDSVAPALYSGNVFRWANRLAIAASLIAMFVLGGVYQNSPWSETAPRPVESRVTNKVEAPKLDDGQQVEPIHPVQNLRLVVTDENGIQHPVDVPLYNADEVGPQMLTSDRSAVPQSLLESFRRRGYDVRRYEQLVPINLQDGRQAVVPVDGYRLVPVGLQPY